MKVAATRVGKVTFTLATIAVVSTTDIVSAFADSAPPSNAGALARELARNAGENLAAGKIAEACSQYAESQRLAPALDTLFGLASCHEKEGKSATAWSEYGEVANQAALQGSKDREVAARAKLDELEPKLPRLVLDATNPHNVVTVEVDGQALGKAAWGPKLPVDRGPHTIAFVAPGKIKKSLKVEADEGKIATVALPMLDADPNANAVGTVAAKEGDTKPKEPPRGGGAAQRVGGYVAIGVGVAALGVGTVFGIKAIGDKNDVDDLCPTPKTCSAEGLDAANHARTHATISTIGFAVGLVATGVGAYLVLNATRDRKTALQLAPTGVSLSGSF